MIAVFSLFLLKILTALFFKIAINSFNALILQPYRPTKWTVIAALRQTNLLACQVTVDVYNV